MPVFKKDLEEEVKMKKLVNSIEKVSVSDSEVQNFYKQNPFILSEQHSYKYCTIKRQKFQHHIL